VMVMVRSILHLVANTDKDAATMLSWINRGITGKIEVDHYATLGLVSVDLATGRTVYANAGHQPLLVLRAADDAIESLEIRSVPIGVERGTGYGSRSLVLRDGDLLLMYTDGVVESMNAQGRQFGRKNLGNSLLRCRGLSAREAISRIRSDLANFAGEARQHDDQTVLVLKMKL
ncbi:MAG TPA: PP2C family protein-serine/threonine phosphatase, partial [Magnetospirillaceae bacterium]|nr:PP2C family protein-serine/threonine phosphatase [Magnetospirillaceae bacterium]